MEARELSKQSETAPKHEQNSKKFLGLFLFVIALTSCLFLTRTIIDSTMNYNSQRAHILSYFTIQSNIILAIWMVTLALFNLTEKKLFKYAVNINISASVTTYILITGSVYWLILVPIFYAPGVTWLFSTSNIWLHTFTPITAVIMFLYAKSCQKPSKVKPRLLIFYIYPLLYITFAIFHAVNEVYLYPMFDPNLLGGWAGVGICITVMCIIFTGLYLALLYVVKKEKNK